MHNIISTFLERLAESYGVWALSLISLVAVMFIIQLIYYIFIYSRISRYRNSRRQGERAVDGISVIVLLHEDYHYLETTLPMIMGQQYPDFELVVVEMDTTEDFSDELAMLKARYPNLASTKIESNPHFPVNGKMGYNVGIKAARYENVLLTTADARPVSDKWLSMMAKGFAKGEVVIGYCGIESYGGFGSAMIRCSRLMQGVRYLSAAVRRHPYRGLLQNIGFTRTLYFDNRGFNHLDMNIGEDDLFIQKIATSANTSVVMNPAATTLQSLWGGMSTWRRLCRFYGTAYRYYPTRAKISPVIEMTSRLLLLISVIVCVAITPPEIKIAVASLWIVRTAIMSLTTWKIRRRLGERKLGFSMLVYDIISPVSSFCMTVSRRFRRTPGVYKL
jgi:glycosyltransferase involved in cell wall biosynthesis